jgi:hypothetical protein
MMPEDPGDAHLRRLGRIRATICADSAESALVARCRATTSDTRVFADPDRP